VADASHLANAVVLDYDIDRPLRRRPGPVYDRRAANDQSLKRPLTLAGAPVGRRWLLSRLRSDCRADGKQRYR
jgi:hypothetical protein